MLRLLLISVFALQPALWQGAVSRAPGHSHAEPGCCVRVETTSCCGESVIESVCSKSGGECRCVAMPDENPAPVPPAPLPRTDRDSLTAVIEPQPDLLDSPEMDGETVRFTAATFSLLQGRSHNEIQALLGVWRT